MLEKSAELLAPRLKLQRMIAWDKSEKIVLN